MGPSRPTEGGPLSAAGAQSARARRRRKAEQVMALRRRSRLRRGVEILGATLLVVVTVAILLSVYHPTGRPADGPRQPEQSSQSFEPRTIATADGSQLPARDYRAAGAQANATVVLLVHDLGQDQQVWHRHAVALQGAGIPSLTLTLRGHPDVAGPGGASPRWTDMDSSQRAAMVGDVRSAVAVLRDQGATEVVVVGAGFGADLAIHAAAAEGWTDIALVVMLSPSVEREGLRLVDALKRSDGFVVALASSGDEVGQAALTTIADHYPHPHALEQRGGDGHGTELLSHQQTVEALRQWMDQAGID